MSQPVLVTGTTGFIGSRVVHKLPEQNISVKKTAIRAKPKLVRERP